MISFLCPTRSRPQQAINLYKSFVSTQQNSNEIIFCLQQGDPKIQEYLYLFKENNFENFFITDPMPTSYLWNQMAFAAKGDLLTLIGDDVEIKTKGWDIIIEEKASKYLDNIFVITVDDGRNDRPQGEVMRCPHPIVHRTWVKTLGYLVPPFFMHRYLDAYTQNLALRLNRFVEIPTIVFDHLKFNYSRDETGQRSRRWLNYDKFVFEKISKRYFEQDLKLLKKQIDIRVQKDL